MDTCFVLGQLVNLAGLQSRPELNGQKGVLKKRLENDRFQVVMTGSGECLSVKMDNMRSNDIKDENILTAQKTQLSVWQSATFLYAFGNTPAKLLTRYFPPSMPDCSILMLGCGDPRHLFFTAWTHLKSKSVFRTTHLNVTMCDIEPSIIARNLMLVKLILENVSPSIIWCLFFSQKIDQICVNVLKDCADGILAVGCKLSDWHASPIGAIMGFCDERTYSTVRSILALYARGRLTKDEERGAKQYRKEFLEKTAKPGVSLNIVLQMQPFGFDALRDCDMHIGLATNYYNDGKAPSCIYDSASKEHFLNPMILRGKAQKHDLHYALDPTMGFHKSMTYSFFLDGPLHTSGRHEGPPDPSLIYAICFRQFGEWLTAFRDLVALGLIVIRSHCGDALVLCDILADAPNAPFRGTQTSQATVLEKVVPRKYDVIDTSNIGDSAGILNILCVTNTLLRSEHAVLFTGILSTASDRTGGLLGFLEQELRMNPTTFSALTNIHLIESFNGLSTCFDEYMSAVASSFVADSASAAGTTFRTLEWRLSSPQSQAALIRMSNEEFVSLFFNVFRAMFKHSHVDGLDRMNRALAVADFNKKLSGTNGFAAPTMKTFVRLVAWAARNVAGIDRPSVFSDLRDAVAERSGLVLRMNVQAELICSMFRFGLLPMGYGAEGRLAYVYHPPSHPHSSLQLDPFPLYEVMLLVPKTALAPLNTFVAITLEMHIFNDTAGFDAMFALIHTSFVKHRALPTDKDWVDQKAAADIITPHFALITGEPEDYEYMSFSFIATKEAVIGTAAGEPFVSLSTHCGEVISIREQMRLFGLTKRVFVAPFSDVKLVSCTNLSGKKFCKQLSDWDADRDSRREVTAKMSGDGSIITEIACTIPFPLDEAIVRKTDNLASEATSHPMQLALAIGRFRVQQLFPVGMDLRTAKVQISRKLHCINVTMQPSRIHPSTGIFKLFPDTNAGAGEVCLQLWGITRIVLDSLPLLDLSLPPSSTHWLFKLAEAQLDRRERSVADATSSLLQTMQETIYAMILNLSGHNETHKHMPKLFNLAREKTNRIVVYANGLRVDLSASSVVLDIAICFLVESTVEDVLPLFMQESASGFHAIRMTDEVYKCWLHSAPALQERARDGWSHRPDCEYFTEAGVQIPRQDRLTDRGNPSVTPHCSCGCGANSLAGTEFYDKFSESHPAAVRHFTRMAISPLFSSFKAHEHGKSPKPKQGPESTVALSSQTSPKQTGEAAETSLKHQCAQCHNQSAALSACARCKSVYYCGKACQRAAWASHKAACKPGP